MDLIDPGALWFLVLVAALLLLARARARPRRTVANLYLWAPPEAADSFQLTLRRLRRHWLLILQAAFMVAVIAALARPVLSPPSRTAVLLVDVSSSMAAREGGTTRIDLARREAQSVLDRLPSSTRVRLMTADAATTDLGEFAAGDASLARALNDIVVTAAAADVPHSVRSARIAGGRSAEIFIVSDHAVPLDSEEGVRWLIAGRPAENRAITVLAARRLPARPDDGVVLATIRNYGGAAVDSAVEITQNGRTLGRQPVRIAPQSSTTVHVEVAGIGGTIGARLTDSDALGADDERFTLVDDAAPVRVGVVGTSSFFLEQALATNRSVSVTAPSGAALLPDQFDVVVCSGCDVPPADAAATLLIAAPAAFAAAAPLSVSQPAHRLASSLDVAGVVAAAAPAAALPPGAEVVLRAGPLPALVAYERQGRRVADLRMSVDAAGLPLTTAFPVLIDNVIGWLSARGERVTEVLAGNPLRWTLAQGEAGASVSVLGPDAKPRDATVNGRQLTVASTSQPGVYRIIGTTAGRGFVVNPVTDGESDLSLTPPAPPRPLGALDTERSGTAADITSPLLAIAFGVLVMEWQARHRAAGRL